MTDAARDRLAAVGEPLEVRADRPFLLREGGWLVEEGKVDVFAVDLLDDEAVGGRHHLFRAQAGHLLLGLEEAAARREIGLLAVATPGTRVVAVGRDQLRKLLRERRCAGELRAMLDQWVELLCASLASDSGPGEYHEIEAGSYSPSAGGERVRPGKGVLWLYHESGRSRLFGHQELEVDGPRLLPLSHHAWLEPSEDSRLVARSTDDDLTDSDLWRGLADFHELFLDSVHCLAERALADERERLRRRAANDLWTLRGALRRLSDTLPRGRRSRLASSALPAGEDGPATPLIQACRQVAASLGLEVKSPEHAAHAAAGDGLDEVAWASRFRVRQVLLRDRWWAQEGGPFLAFLADGHQPVALLPGPRGTYLLHDPSTGSAHKVDPSLAERLEPTAFTFYRPFANRAMQLLDLLRFGLRGCSRDLVTVLATSSAVALLSLVTPIATGTIFNDIIPSASRTHLVQLTLVLLVIAVASALFQLTGSIAVVRVEGKVGAALQSGVWDRLLSLPMPFFRPYTAGDLAHRAMGIDAIRQVLSANVIHSLLIGGFSLFHFALLFHYSADLAVWAIPLIALTFAVTLFVGRLHMTPERQVAAIRTKLSGTVLQLLTSISKLQVAGAEIHAFALWARRFSEQRQHQYRSRTYANWQRVFNAMFPVAAQLVIYALAFPLLTRDLTLRPGDFLAFMASFTLCQVGVLGAGSALVSAAVVVPMYEQARPILEALPEVDAAKADPGTLSGDIEVQHVRFRYDPDGPLVLRDVTFEVQPGEFVALVGPSGSGKSTLLRLLLAFETPEAGALYYDRQDLAGLDKQAVRGQIGVVLQGARLMSGDIFTNIVGSSRATLDDAWEAARLAGLDEDIRRMPMQMHTVLSEGGGAISGGQRQRLMIARALVRKPKMLFFDEATSALDNRTQAIISESLDRMQVTRVVVAHRLSTIENADTIHVLEHGRLVESGDFQELLARDGLFAALARRQLV